MPPPDPRQNLFLLAADGSPHLIPLLTSHPSLATTQDSTGYSLLHALTSYNHLTLLRSLITQFHPPPNTLDSDGETALFVAETVEAATYLIEEAGLDPEIRNEEGLTAEEKIALEGEFQAVADYLRERRLRTPIEGKVVRRESVVEEEVEKNGERRKRVFRREESRGEEEGSEEEEDEEEDRGEGRNVTSPPPKLPKGMRLNVGTMDEGEVQGEVDEGFRRRIEELAMREDFREEGGQRELRELIRDAVRDVGAQDRNVRERRS